MTGALWASVLLHVLKMINEDRIPSMPNSYGYDEDQINQSDDHKKTLHKH